ncbi:MAG: hypothetical protein OXE17_07035 [Chloroflexi bacterium]|nr:hypothetical protein [Chloroflexota bacterium]
MNYTNYGILVVILLFVFATFYMTRAGNTAREEFRAAQPTPANAGIHTATGASPEGMTLEEARSAVDFHILTPAYLPPGYRQWEKVFVRPDPLEISRVKGVLLQYLPDTSPGGDQDPPEILITQHTGASSEMSVVNSLKLPPVDIGRFQARVGQVADGTTSIIWDDPDRGVYVWVESGISQEELTKVARSLH